MSEIENVQEGDVYRHEFLRMEILRIDPNTHRSSVLVDWDNDKTWMDMENVLSVLNDNDYWLSDSENKTTTMNRSDRLNREIEDRISDIDDEIKEESEFIRFAASNDAHYAIAFARIKALKAERKELEKHID